jgi:hypothetical protein
MTLKRIGPFSCAKISGLLYGLMGLIAGAIISFIALLLGSVGSDYGGGGALSGLFGVGAIILLPIFYGFIGFVGGAIMAWIYNLVAASVGGLELEFDNERSSAPSM